MPKVFNTTAVCVPEEHYMVNIDERLREIRNLIDTGAYFTINKARQYGKTTTLMALSQYLQKDYYVVLMDFQTFGSADFSTEHYFAVVFAASFLESFRYNEPALTEALRKALDELEQNDNNESFTLRPLFKGLRAICAASDKPIVLMIDEVDSAANNQVFLDFLAQIRAQYIKRFQQTTFQSVILAGVYDIKNLRRKIRQDEEHKYNSPWNIATDFEIDMSFSKDGIAGMLREYERDYHTGMNVDEIAGLIYDYTSGYPFLVSRLCQLMDKGVSLKEGPASKNASWTKQGFHEAVRMLLSEKNTLFESLIGKLKDYPELNVMLRSLLFSGRSIAYNADETAIDIATMFGFIKKQNANVAIANRIFETRLYNYYLSAADMQEKDIYKASLRDKTIIEAVV